MSTTAVREKPILFSAAMVRAILDGSKTQTRRVLKSRVRITGWPKWYSALGWTVLPHPGGGWWAVDVPNYSGRVRGGDDRGFFSPYGAVGDRLWVREAWAHGVKRPIYKANFDVSDGFGSVVVDLKTGDTVPLRWRSPIHMPRWASRITLELTDVRVERLQSISEHDARDRERVAHGFDIVLAYNGVYRDIFREMWDSINGKRAAWKDDPWVWALGFKRVEPA